MAHGTFFHGIIEAVDILTMQELQDLVSAMSSEIKRRIEKMMMEMKGHMTQEERDEIASIFTKTEKSLESLVEQKRKDTEEAIDSLFRRLEVGEVYANPNGTITPRPDSAGLARIK